MEVRLRLRMGLRSGIRSWLGLKFREQKFSFLSFSGPGTDLGYSEGHKCRDETNHVCGKGKLGGLKVCFLRWCRDGDGGV